MGKQGVFTDSRGGSSALYPVGKAAKLDCVDTDTHFTTNLYLSLHQPSPLLAASH